MCNIVFYTFTAKFQQIWNYTFLVTANAYSPCHSLNLCKWQVSSLFFLGLCGSKPVFIFQGHHSVRETILVIWYFLATLLMLKDFIGPSMTRLCIFHYTSIHADKQQYTFLILFLIYNKVAKPQYSSRSIH